MLDVLGDRPAVIAREVTKVHEEFLRAGLSELICMIKEVSPLKGEITLMIGPGSSDGSMDEENLEKQILSELEKADSSASAVAKDLSKKLGIPKNTVYQKILEIKSARVDNSTSGKGDMGNG
jgi:16S rRNA (cytidine1402-2'-O)-methyltransferase